MVVLADLSLFISQGFTMFFATNAIYKTRQTHQARQSTTAQMLDNTVRVILLIAFICVGTACSNVPLIPGI
jgi:hypothetical protein